VEQVEITKEMLREVSASVPMTREEALDPEWLSQVLAHISGGKKVATVELTDVVQAMAAKILVAVTFEGIPDKVYKLCIKGFIDFDMHSSAIHTVSMRESDFYLQIAPRISMRTPPCVAVVTNRTENLCIFIMADMIASGVHFYDAREPLTVSQVEETLDQLARLHAHPELLEGRDWIPCRVDEIVASQYPSWEKTQELMHDERRGNLSERTLDATLLKKGMETLATLNKQLPQTILHGDVHPGNVYRTAEGKMAFTDWQLIQHGHWSFDVAYHINSVLPIEVAEKEERNLLNHYLEAVRKHGGTTPDADEAWKHYQRAPVYGYYHWAITQRVRPVEITHQAFARLGAAVTRHDSYKLLGL